MAGLAACEGRQSVLSPAGVDADALATMFWVMFAGAVVLWLLLNGAFFFVTRVRQQEMPRAWAEGLIVGGGIVFPTVLLTVLLSWGLNAMPPMRAAGDGLVVHVQGEQWWWRVAYETPDGRVVSANEVRLPTGARTDIVLTADDVIHSFWIPSLGGKTDMIPGRTNRMSLEPSVPGVYRGQCAEFCGLSHAQMAFEAVAMEPGAFAAWLEAEAGPALSPGTELARAGAAVFAEEGCGACHAIRGTGANGQVGPDLTHVGARKSLGGGILPNEAGAMARWISDTRSVKPGVRMPPYPHIDGDRMQALTAYLGGLT